MSHRKFAIIGHRAQATGKLNLNDLAGSAGRMDVLVRAVNSALFLSHGIREDTEITLHLLSGNQSGRRIRFDGAKLRGVHPDERAIAGQIAKVLREERVAAGVWQEIHHGISHSWGNLQTTLKEWQSESTTIVQLTAMGEPLSQCEKVLTSQNVGFVLSDDHPFSEAEETLLAEEEIISASLGEGWLQGHIAVGIVHYILDEAE